MNAPSALANLRSSDVVKWLRHTLRSPACRSTMILSLRLPVHNMQMRECIYRPSPTHHRGGVIVQRLADRGILKVSLAMIRLQA
jgi:hypothetical protein